VSIFVKIRGLITKKSTTTEGNALEMKPTETSLNTMRNTRLKKTNDPTSVDSICISITWKILKGLFYNFLLFKAESGSKASVPLTIEQVKASFSNKRHFNEELKESKKNEMRPPTEAVHSKSSKHHHKSLNKSRATTHGPRRTDPDMEVNENREDDARSSGIFKFRLI
jgi:hypothetical protein